MILSGVSKIDSPLLFMKYILISESCKNDNQGKKIGRRSRVGKTGLQKIPA